FNGTAEFFTPERPACDATGKLKKTCGPRIPARLPFDGCAQRTDGSVPVIFRVNIGMRYNLFHVPQAAPLNAFCLCSLVCLRIFKSLNARLCSGRQSWLDIPRSTSFFGTRTFPLKRCLRAQMLCLVPTLGDFPRLVAPYEVHQ